MSIDQAVFRFAGIMVLLSVALTYYVSQYFLLFTAFIGLNLLQSSFTGFCPAAMFFRLLGVKAGCAFK
ncbi:MAG: YgaP family membrane protein [Acidibrevibacterium sp.]|uniref:YgaP family membrane protein n=1 Tax=Acidibrevibacterium sp. TaxID=2606776 RepID=UPI003D087FB6